MLIFNSILIISSTIRFSTTSVSCWTEISLDSLQPLMFVLKKLLLDFPLFTGATTVGQHNWFNSFCFFKCKLLILVLQTQSKGLAIHSKSLLSAGILKNVTHLHDRLRQYPVWPMWRYPQKSGCLINVHLPLVKSLLHHWPTQKTINVFNLWMFAVCIFHWKEHLW